MRLRPISIDGFSGVLPSDAAGDRPQLQWIAIDRLVVDETYQRPITGGGRRNVMDIARAFRWSRFTPVVVAPIDGGRFAIVDGQHRTTAALLAGISEVPCQIVAAGQVEQAEAFSAINAKVTRVGRLAIFRAALAAGEGEALTIEKAARRARVKILPYPKSELNQEPGETMAVGTIAQCLRNYGEHTLVLALRVVVETRNNVKGGLLSDIIAANCAAIHKLPARIRTAEGSVIAAFEQINLIREMSKARAYERPKGVPAWRELADRLARQLAAHFQVAA